MLVIQVIRCTSIWNGYFYLKLETLIIVSLIIHTINGQNPINSEMSSNKQIKLPEEEKDKDRRIKWGISFPKNRIRMFWKLQ
ncbi:hypothetical protein Avbf_18177 [Armadillidium vulgare]|nr:hypothetical protein Avbf_18177 [Armadillidium vulgare]